MLLVGLLFVVSAAYAGLLHALAQRHSFGGAQADQTQRSQTRPRPRACMLCAYKDDSQLPVLCWSSLKLLYAPRFMNAQFFSHLGHNVLLSLPQTLTL